MKHYTSITKLILYYKPWKLELIFYVHSVNVVISLAMTSGDVIFLF